MGTTFKQLQAPIKSHPADAVFTAPSRRLTDQREDTRRANSRQGSSRHGQDFRTHHGSDPHSLTIVRFVESGPGEEQVSVASPFDQGVVDELAAVVGVQADQRERQAGLDLAYRFDNPAVGTVLQRHVLGPPRVHVRHGQRVNELALQGRPAMQHKIGFEETRACSCSSPALRTWIELRSNGPGFVPDRPTNCAPSRVGFNTWLIVAPDTASSCARVPSFKRSSSSS